MAAKKGEPFPYVMVGASVIAVAWQFGHLWWGIGLVAGVVLLPLIPVLITAALMGAAILVGSFVGTMYTLTLFVYQKVVRRGATYSHP